MTKKALKKQLENIDFTVVQDLWMSDTARMADLVLPASMPWEFGGSYTSSQRKIQQIDKQLEVDIAHDSFMQLAALLEKKGITSPKKILAKRWKKPLSCFQNVAITKIFISIM